MLKGFSSPPHGDTTASRAFLHPSGCTCIHLHRRTPLHLINIVIPDWTALHLGYISIRAVRRVVCILFSRHWCLSHPCVLLLVRIELVPVSVLLGFSWWAGSNRGVVALRVCSATSE